MKASSLERVIKERYRSVRAFYNSVELGMPYSTLMRYMEDDDKFEHMPISNFIKLADALAISPDALLDKILKYSAE